MSFDSMGYSKQYDGAPLGETCSHFVLSGEAAHAVSLMGDLELLANDILAREFLLGKFPVRL